METFGNRTKAMDNIKELARKAIDRLDNMSVDEFEFELNKHNYFPKRLDRFSSDLTHEFLNSISRKDIDFYSKRDSCGIACLDMKAWAMENHGVELVRVRGEFLADTVVSEKADFTKKMKAEFMATGGDFSSPSERKAFIESHPDYKDEWKKIPHYWLVDEDGNIHDPSGPYQIIREEFAENLDASRYLMSPDQKLDFGSRPTL